MSFEAMVVWVRHAERVSTGACVRRAPRRLFIDENVDVERRWLMDGFLNASVRAIKTAFPKLASELGVDLGFWFQKPAAFERGATAMGATDALIANYIPQSRAGWSEQLIKQRNDIEHDGWSLPRVDYTDDGAMATAVEPVAGASGATAFTRHMLERLSCAIEEISAHLLRKRMHAGIGLHEIAIAQRPAEAPERFRITATPGGEPVWSLLHHSRPFEEV